MKDLLYNLDSVEVSYGDNLLNAAIQINERITEIQQYLENDAVFNEFEKSETAGRLNKLVDLNNAIQSELEKQLIKIEEIKSSLGVKSNFARA
jgi:hypothetical protein